MSPFQRALRFTLWAEGGFVDNPADPGGRTNFGISETYHPEAWADGKVTRAEAEDIYFTEYWEAAHCNAVHDLVAVAMFDCAVSTGVTRAIQFLQAAVGVRCDGRFGVVTNMRARAAEPLVTALRIVDVRSGYWLARARGEQIVFRDGWMNRSNALRAELQREG